MPLCTSFGTAQNNNRLSTIDVSAPVPNSYCINNPALCEFIMRAESADVGYLPLNNTPIYEGNGYIYVPDEEVSNFKTKFSTYASSIVGVSEYPKALQCETITDSWADIAASISGGTYATDYSVGDTKLIDVGGTKVLCRIVGFDCDDLVSGGKAHISWMSVGAIDILNMSDSSSSIGGWTTSKAHDWLTNIIYPQIESDARSMIVEVVKTSKDYTSYSASAVQTANCKLWLPSYRELFGGSTVEDSGCDYTSVFSSATNRIKYVGLMTSGTSTIYYTRSCNSGNSYYTVTANGASGNSSYYSYGMIIGFCM